MTAEEFLALSTRLVADMNAWVAEAGRDDSFTPADLATLSAATKIIERVTLREAATKPDSSSGQILI